MSCGRTSCGGSLPRVEGGECDLVVWTEYLCRVTLCLTLVKQGGNQQGAGSEEQGGWGSGDLLFQSSEASALNRTTRSLQKIFKSNENRVHDRNAPPSCSCRVDHPPENSVPVVVIHYLPKLPRK